MIALRRSFPFWILLAGLAVFLCLSNGFDWDHFYSATEVDLRSWLADHEAPLWSYQFCAGVTRIGDPQAFGLSPLFLPVVLFGSIIGIKVFLLGASIIGWIFLKRSGALVFALVHGSTEPSEEIATTIDFFATCVIFSNYFLWHFHHGHITFALIFFAFGFLSYFLKALVRSLSWRDGVYVTLLTFVYLTGGFYHSAIFFALPIAISLLAFLIVAGRSGALHGKLKSFAFLISGVVIGAVVSSYKTLGVLNYQHLNPRVLEGTPEPLSFLETLIFQFVPTYHYRFVGLSYLPSPWGIWEYSAFSLLGWLLLAAFLSTAGAERKNLWADVKRNALGRALVSWLSALAFIAFSLSLSAQSPLSLHHWFNAVFSDAIRVIGRYQIVWIVWLFFALTLLISLRPQLTKLFGTRTRIAATVFLFLNLFTFTTLNTHQLIMLWRTPSTVPDHIRFLRGATDRSDFASHMFPIISNGGIVPNCYNPLSHGKDLIEKYGDEFSAKTKNAVHPLLSGTEDKACLENTFVTQNDIVIDPSCAVGTCLNLNAINIYRPIPSRLAYDATKRRWCVK